MNFNIYIQISDGATLVIVLAPTEIGNSPLYQDSCLVDNTTAEFLEKCLSTRQGKKEYCVTSSAKKLLDTLNSPKTDKLVTHLFSTILGTRNNEKFTLQDLTRYIDGKQANNSTAAYVASC